MTLKKNDGSWSMTKISCAFGILASIAICVEAAPTFFSYCREGIAPWTSLPAKVDAMREDLNDIKAKLDITPQYSQRETNINMTRK